MFTKIYDKDEVIYRNELVGIDFTLIPVWDIPETKDRWLAFKSIMNMPAQRLLVFQNIQELEKLGIQKVELEKKMQEIKEACKNEDTHTAYSLADYVEKNVKDQWDISKTMRAIIPLVVIKESEVQFMANYDQELCNKNMVEIEGNPQALELFFYIVQKHIENSNESVLKPSLSFLTEAMKTRKANYTNQQHQNIEKKSAVSKIWTNLSSKFAGATSKEKTT